MYLLLQVRILHFEARNLIFLFYLHGNVNELEQFLLSSGFGQNFVDFDLRRVTLSDIEPLLR